MKYKSAMTALGNAVVPQQFYPIFRMIAETELESYKSVGSIGHLRELVQAEQEGRLVVLPFRLGDCIYRIATKRKYANHVLCSSYIKKITIKPENVYKYINEIGKTVFLTREEAEAALAQRGESNG